MSIIPSILPRWIIKNSVQGIYPVFPCNGEEITPIYCDINNNGILDAEEIVTDSFVAACSNTNNQSIFCGKAITKCEDATGVHTCDFMIDTDIGIDVCTPAPASLSLSDSIDCVTLSSFQFYTASPFNLDVSCDTNWSGCLSKIDNKVQCDFSYNWIPNDFISMEPVCQNNCQQYTNICDCADGIGCDTSCVNKNKCEEASDRGCVWDNNACSLADKCEDLDIENSFCYNFYEGGDKCLDYTPPSIASMFLNSSKPSYIRAGSDKRVREEKDKVTDCVTNPDAPAYSTSTTSTASTSSVTTTVGSGIKEMIGGVGAIALLMIMQ